jgi:hypothetical protein
MSAPGQRYAPKQRGQRRTQLIEPFCFQFGVVEPTLPRNWLGLKYTYTLSYGDMVDISGVYACFSHHLGDSRPRHAARKLHPVQSFFSYDGENLRIVHDSSRRGFTIDETKDNHSLTSCDGSMVGLGFSRAVTLLRDKS